MIDVATELFAERGPGPGRSRRLLFTESLQIDRVGTCLPTRPTSYASAAIE